MPKFDFGTSMGSRDIAILVYVGIVLRGYSVAKVSIAKRKCKICFEMGYRCRRSVS